MLADIGLERLVVAGLCQYGQDAYIDVADVIEVETFTTDYNQALYKCIQNINDEGGDVDLASLTVAATNLGFETLLFDNKKDYEYIRSLFNFPITLENVREYAVRIEKLNVARKAQQKHKEAYDALGELKGNESIDSILQISEGPIFDLIDEMNKSQDSGPHLLTEGSDEILQNLIENPRDNVGLPTPWPEYNAAIGGGLRRGGVTLIAARPKKGKTTLAKEAMVHWTVKLEIPCLMLDTEMVRTDQLFRALASISGVDIYKIETGKFGKNEKEKQAVLEANKLLKENPRFWYESICGKPFDEVLSIIRRWIVKEVGYDEEGDTNPCVVVYDYFKLMSQDDLGKLKEYEAMGYQISRLSDFCKMYDIPVLAFVQLNREKDISQSDRLRWLAHSVSWFDEKTADQMLADGGKDAGNRLLQPRDVRFGPGLPMDYINMQLDGDINKVREIGLNSQQAKKQEIEETGFESTADGTEFNETVQSGSDQRETD